ncbi:MAG: pyridine nucleotide-disulfide oxidoreductase, partial [bacterium]|nr:pyridine nucleotide-disulfide oxidoreductase [Candidatus Kapabacteria bacterium]
RLNHEEIIKALEEGIYFIEGLSPIAVNDDRYGASESVDFERQAIDDNGKWRATGDVVTMRARSIMIAAGTSPNTIIDRENPRGFEYDQWNQFFAPFVAAPARPVNGVVNGSPSANGKQTLGEILFHKAERGEVGFFTSYNQNGKLISYFGDNHPKYAGNVVKAMASARDGYPQIVELFADRNRSLDPSQQPARDDEWNSFVDELDRRIVARVHDVIRLTPTIVEIILHAPMQAERFRPGQFYRLQNYETTAYEIAGTRLAMEGLALTGAWVDVERGLVSLIVLEMGASSRMCAMLRKGEEVVLMGPTGAPTEIPNGENVALLGGGLGNAVLFSIGKALRAAGCRVVYFAGYKRGVDLYHQDDVEESADQVIWSTDTGDVIEVRRPTDRFIEGNILEAMVAFAKGDLGEQIVPLNSVTRIIAIGSDRMMSAVQSARHGLLAPYLGEHVAVGSINSPMQCMMKEICAQCLQRHIDPKTGEEIGFVFSCFNQDQHLDNVDFHFLNSRLKANSLLEKMSNQWFDHLLRKEQIPGI